MTAHALRRLSLAGRRTHRLLAACALGLGLLLAGPAGAAPLDDLRRLVEAGQFEQAWTLGQRSPELLGNAHFDFLYGVAAVNSGHAAEGLLALERHLAVVPANDRARLELARGYFLLGEYPRARSEFEFVLRYNPTPATRRVIEGFLQSMALRDVAERRGSANLYVEVGAGHDSNVNVGTWRDEVQFSFGAQPLDPQAAARARPDAFAQFSAGGQHAMRVSNQFSVFAGADLDLRRNEHEHDYDQATLQLNAGFTQLHASGLYRLTLGVGEMRLGGQRYRDSLSLGLEGQWTLSPVLTLLGQWQVAEQRYGESVTQGVVESQASHDGRSVAWALMLTRQFADAPWAPSVGVRASLAQDSNTRGRPDFSRDVPLLRLFAAASPTDRWRLSGGLTLYRQDFGAVDSVFGSARSDRSWAADLSAQFAIDARWSLRAELSRQQNRSNQPLFDSRRSQLGMKLRGQF